ncbi:hypothetical protein Q0Y04_06655 [Clostridioides difficile]|nr:hypothetical protein Q0Y04_06655 [Clostridioides difficile]
MSYNKFLAKIASDLRKPNGLTVITEENAQDFLDKLPVNKFLVLEKLLQILLKI